MRRPLLLAVRDQLRAAPPAGLGLTQAQTELMGPDGKPPARCGRLFVAVCRGQRSNDALDSLDERYDVKLVVTLRINEPLDRLGPALLEKVNQGMDDQLDAIRRVIVTNQYVIMNAANVYLQDAATAAGVASVYGFTEPLRFLGDDQATLVGGDWFAAESKGPSVGVKSEIRLGKARRLQPVDEVF